MRSLSRTLALTIVLSFAVISCGGADAVTAPAASVVGTWELRSIDGDPLPAVSQINSGGYWETLAEVATFYPGGQLDLDGQMRHSPTGQLGSYGSAWSWQQNDAEVIFSGDQGGGASISGDILTRHEYSGRVFVYFRL